MVFSSTIFLFLFFPCIIILYYLPFLRGHRSAQNCLLFAASLLFYAWGEPLFVFLLIMSIAVTWCIGKAIGNALPVRKKRVLAVGIVYHIGVLFFFKYFSFLLHELSLLVGSVNYTADIRLPIGISFFTFQMMSYLFDVYYGKAEVQRSPLNLGLYVSFFPQLIAGPIVRYETIESQIMERTETRASFEAGIRRFILGIGKKAILADTLGIVADSIFGIAHIEGIAALTGWIGAVAFMLQIYFDFSGYSDMAIGLGRCFGFRFSENFNRPYLAASVSDFWKRWHISLTDWFRDYVYIPLGGNRKGKKRQIINTFIVWTLTGIWHGANWTFLAWGLVYCCIQLAERYLYSPSRWPKLLSHFYTLLTVCLCWVIFKSQNLPDALRYLGDLFGRSGLTDENTVLYLKNSVVIFGLSIGCCLVPAWQSCRGARLCPPGLCEILQYLLLTVILITAVIFSVGGGYSPFIYFNF